MLKYKFLFLVFSLLSLILLIEKAIHVEAIDTKPGIVNKLWGNIPNIENKNPCAPYSLTKNPTVKPKANPLNKITTGIIGSPIIIIPVNQINPIVLKLSIIDCFSIGKLSKLLPSIVLKKELRNNIISFFWSISNIFIVIAPTTIPIAKTTTTKK